KAFVIGLVLIQVIYIGKRLLQMIAAIGWPIAQLCIQVMMKIALPWRNPSVICSPDRLKRNGRSAPSGSGAEFILLQVPLVFQHDIRNPDGGFTPEILPPCKM